MSTLAWCIVWFTFFSNIGLHQRVRQYGNELDRMRIMLNEIRKASLN